MTARSDHGWRPAPLARRTYRHQDRERTPQEPTVGEPLLSPSAQEACRDEGGVLLIVLPKDLGSFGLSHDVPRQLEEVFLPPVQKGCTEVRQPRKTTVEPGHPSCAEIAGRVVHSASNRFDIEASRMGQLFQVAGCPEPRRFPRSRPEPSSDAPLYGPKRMSTKLADHNSPARPQHASHFTKRLFRIRQKAEDCDCYGDIKRAVREKATPPHFH